MPADDFDVSRIMLSLFDHSSESITVTDLAGRALYANQATEIYGGTPRAEIQGKLIWDVFPDLAGFYETGFRRAAREQVPVTLEYYHLPVSKWFEVRFYPSPDAVAIFSADINERKQASEALRLSEEKYRRLLETVDQGYVLCEMVYADDGRPIDHRYLEVNPAFEVMTGLVDAAGKTACEMVPGLEEWWAERYGQVVASGEMTRFQHGSDAMGRIFDVFALPIGGPRFVVLFTDVTAQTRRDEENAALNVRLRRAMQETHHRVKNNLQVIAALVEIQAEDAGNTAASTPLRRINQHIQALAVIHDLLTKNAATDADLASLGAKSVLETLLPLLQNTAGNRRIAWDIDDISLGAEKAASLALLVSECVSNAIKHGRHAIEITLRNQGETARLEICDDGDGFPQDFDPRRAADTGLQLIESAGRWDLRGDITYSNHAAGGGRVMVIFPVV